MPYFPLFSTPPGPSERVGPSYRAKPPMPAVPAGPDAPICSVAFTGAGTPVNLMGPRVPATVTGTLGWSTGPWGPARDVAPIGGSNYETFTLSAPVRWDRGPWTVEVWITPRSFQTASPFLSGLFMCGAPSVYSFLSGHMFRLNGAMPQAYLLGTAMNFATALVAGNPYQIVTDYDGAVLRGFVNGVLDGSVAVSPSAGTLDTFAQLWRDDSTGLGRGPDCQGHAFNVWPRALSAAEVADRYRDLGGLWRTRRPTLALLAGSYAATVRVGGGAAGFGPLTATGTGSVAVPSYSGSASPSVGPLTAAGSGTATVPSYSGSASPSVGPLTAAGSGSFAGVSYPGAASAAIGPLAAAGEGAFVPLPFVGAGSASIGALTAAGRGLLSAGLRVSLVSWQVLALQPPATVDVPVPVTPPVGPAESPDENEAWLDIQRRLVALGVFARVELGTSDNDMPEPADRSANALVWPEDWTDQPAGDSQESTRVAGEKRFNLAIEFAEPNPANRLLRLNYLCRLCKNALNGKDLGGVCEPDWTLLGDGRNEPAAYPNGVMVCRGRFRVSTVGVANFNEDSVYLT